MLESQRVADLVQKRQAVVVPRPRRLAGGAEPDVTAEPLARHVGIGCGRIGAPGEPDVAEPAAGAGVGDAEPGQPLDGEARPRQRHRLGVEHPARRRELTRAQPREAVLLRRAPVAVVVAEVARAIVGGTVRVAVADAAATPDPAEDQPVDPTVPGPPDRSLQAHVPIPP